MKKLLSVLMMCLLIAASLLAGCGKPSPEATPDPSETVLTEQALEAGFPLEEQLTLTAFVDLTESNVIDLPTNEFTKWMEEATNIHIEYQVAKEEGQQKLNLLLSSGATLPDILIASLNNAQQIEYGSQGMIIPLNEMIDQYGGKLQVPGRPVPKKDSMRSRPPDGNIYSMPTFEDCYHCQYSQKMWINKTWLDNLDLPMPTTTDEFYDVLTAFKTQDPNGNGIQDEVPLSGCTNWWHGTPETFLMNSFIYYEEYSRVMVKDGQVIPVFTQPEFKDGLEYLRRLYDDGLLDTEAFTQMPDQLRQLVENGDAVMLGACQTGTPAAFADDTGEATKNFVTLAPLAGPDGVKTTSYTPSTLGTKCAITKDCQNPQAAFLWLDFLLSEEATMRQVFGVEGTDWRPAQSGEVGLDGNPGVVKEINVLAGMNEQNQGAELMTAVTKKIFDGRVVDPNDQWYIESRLQRETAENYDIGAAPEEILPPFFMTTEDAKTNDEIAGPIYDYVTENIAKFVTGARDLDTEWDTFVEEVQSMGLDQYIELLQKYYDMTK